MFGQHSLEGLLLILEPRPRLAGVWAGGRAWGILGLSPAPFVSVFRPSALQRTTANPDLQMGKLRLSEARSPGQGETSMAPHCLLEKPKSLADRRLLIDGLYYLHLLCIFIHFDVETSVCLFLEEDPTPIGCVM